MITLNIILTIISLIVWFKNYKKYKNGVEMDDIIMDKGVSWYILSFLSGIYLVSITCIVIIHYLP